MGFFDLFKSKEERERIEWDNLSDKEKIKRINKEKEEQNKKAEEHSKLLKKNEELYANCERHITTLLKQHPGEYYTEKMILEIIRPQNEDERSRYKRLLLPDLYEYPGDGNEWVIGKTLKDAGIQLMVHNNTIFYYYPK